MATPVMREALLRPAGLQVTWTDVPPPAAQDGLQLALILDRAGAQRIELVVEWRRDVEEPVVLQRIGGERRDHDRPTEAIERRSAEVVVTFPTSWLGDLVGGRDVTAAAVVAVNGLEASRQQLEVDLQE